MSSGAHLPEFVREALEADVGSAAAPARALTGSEQGSHPAVANDLAASLDVEGIERCFATLLEAACPERGTRAPGAGAAAAGNLEDFAPSAALLERLRATLDTPPHRYAPFFERAAELFDLPESVVIDELGRLAEPKVWRFAGLPGIQHVPVKGGPKVASAETLFVRFAPGVRFPKHRHTGLERVLVLEGSYQDTNGVVHRAGELREWAAGSEHGFLVDKSEPCIFASVVFGRRFEAWPLRALASVLGR
jgi:anti-sigma factor ChrR (cupin superfamily)